MKHPKNHSPLGLFLVVALFFAMCVRSFGLGIALPDHDAFATARGNAFVATADDPAAVFYNPAGISQLDGMNMSAGVYGLGYTSSYRNGGAKFDSKTEWAALPDVFSTYSISNYNITLGFGTYSPYGLVEEWPKNAPFVPFGKRGEIDYFTGNPVIAWQIIPTLSVAAGPTINYSQAQLQEYIPAGSFGPGSPALETRFHGHDWDFGYNAGILWHPLPEHSFGLNYRSATEMEYSGHADLPLGGSIPATAKYKFPREVSFGYSYRPTEKWNIESDLEWLDWETLNKLTLKTASGANLQNLPFNWQASWIFKLGGTHYFGDGWRASAGYMFVENSVPSKSFSALVPDSDRHIFSVGIGKRFHKLSLDAAYQLAWGPSRNVSGDIAAPPANGNYEFLSHALTFNVGYHF